MTIGSWSTGPVLPAARVGIAVATDDQGRVYAMGGQTPSNATALATVYRYDPTANAWSTLASLPTGLKNAMGASDGQGRVYFIGGDAGAGGSPIVSTVYRYDPTANTWSTMAPLPAARSYAASATDAQGRIYVIGGTSTGLNANYTSTVYRYDPTANAWSTLTALPSTANQGIAAAADLQGRIYVTGGQTPTSATAATATYRYDPSTSAWSTLANVPGTLRRGHQSVADFGGLIYVLGGTFSGTTENAYRYDPAGSTWTAVAPLPTVRTDPGAAVDGSGHILYIGGSGTGTTVDVGQFNSPPNAPLLTSMTNGEFVDSHVTNRASHQFSDPDPGDSQSSFFLRYRIRDIGAAWTSLAEQVTPNQWYDFPPDTLAFGDYERQVATRDSQGIPVNTADLAWSASGFFSVGTTPATPTFTDPIANQSIFLNSYTATISAPNVTQSEWRSVADDGAGNPNPSVIYSASVVKTTGNLRTFTYSFPVNNRKEHLQSRVFFGGLWSSWADVPVQISFTPPTTPTVTLTPINTRGDGYGTDALEVAITNPAPGAGVPATSYNDVLIDDGDGTGLIRKATNLATNTTWVYRLPRSGFDYAGHVQVRAVATNGTTATGTA